MCALRQVLVRIVLCLVQSLMILCIILHGTVIIGVSLSEPHTNQYYEKSLYFCVYVCMRMYVCIFVGSCLATEVFIGNLLAMGRGWVIIK